MINTSGYSFASSAYPEEVDKVISIMEACVGAGCMIGPILGSFVYNAFGFFWTFAVFGIAMTPISFILLIALPKPADVRLSNQGLIDDEQDDMEELETKSNILQTAEGDTDQ